MGMFNNLFKRKNKCIKCRKEVISLDEAMNTVNALVSTRLRLKDKSVDGNGNDLNSQIAQVMALGLIERQSEELNYKFRGILNRTIAFVCNNCGALVCESCQSRDIAKCPKCGTIGVREPVQEKLGELWK